MKIVYIIVQDILREVIGRRMCWLDLGNWMVRFAVCTNSWEFMNMNISDM